MIIIVLLCLCLATQNYNVDGRMPSISQEEDLELEKQLKLINKPPVKTLQTEFGHIVDCIDINKQLAFDNPLLKNHSVQLKPSFQDSRTKANVQDRSTRHSKIGLDKNSCPGGTIPIRRTTKDDLIRAKWLSNIAGILTKELPGEHFAEVRLNKVVDSSYYGISGTISAYNPTVARQDQMSGAYIWVSNGTFDNVNAIFVGWQVYPALYGDNRTYFFTSWADNMRHTGCYNMLCSGYVQVDKSVYLGSPVTNTSTYGGPQFDMSVTLSLDPNTKNWWLRTLDKDVGYFPAALFSNMASADQGGWSGRTMTPVGTASPPMGSGHFPDDNFRHACYIRQMRFQNQSRQEVGPELDMVRSFADNSSCYDVKYYGYESEAMGYCLVFGGPGGNCGN